MDQKTLFWLLFGMIVGSYLCKEMGVDCFQAAIDGLNSVINYVQANASK